MLLADELFDMLSLLFALQDWPIPNMVIPHNLRVCTSCGTSLLLVAQVWLLIIYPHVICEDRDFISLHFVLYLIFRFMLQYQLRP